MPVPLVNKIELRQAVEILDALAPRRVVDRALREAEITRDLLYAQPGFLPYVTEAVLLESVARSLGERHLGALTGQAFNYDGFDAFAEYVLAAPDLSDALVRSRRAIALIHAGSSFKLWQDGDSLVFGYRTGLETVVGHRHLSEGAIFLITHVFRHYLGADWRPRWIELPGKKETNVARLEALAGSELRSGAEILAIAVDAEDLLTPNPMPPEPEAVLTLGDLPARMGITHPRTTSDMVKEVMRTQLALGALSQDEVARRLSLGPRGLQRALMAEGVTFRELRNGLIQSRASALLTDSTLDIDQIARVLGYTEPNSFRRAFRSWTGISPGQFRQASGQRHPL